MTRLTAFAIVLLCASVARAQGVGFVGGGTVDPEQVYVGSFFETPPLAGNIHLRPGIDGSWGQGLKIASINADIIFRTEVGPQWRFYTGGGPSIQIVRVDTPSHTGSRFAEDDVTGGLEGLMGFAHESGFFSEFKFGRGGDQGPHLKFGAGFRFGGHKDSSPRISKPRPSPMSR